MRAQTQFAVAGPCCWVHGRHGKLHCLDITVDYLEQRSETHSPRSAYNSWNIFLCSPQGSARGTNPLSCQTSGNSVYYFLEAWQRGLLKLHAVTQPSNLTRVLRNSTYMQVLNSVLVLSCLGHRSLLGKGFWFSWGKRKSQMRELLPHLFTLALMYCFSSSLLFFRLFCLPRIYSTQLVAGNTWLTLEEAEEIHCRLPSFVASFWRRKKFSL